MIIGIIGSRRRNNEEDYNLVLKAWRKISAPHDTLVSGGCPQGGDAFAERIAQECSIPIKIHKANWNLYGRYAGFQRNGLIAKDADILIACVAEDRTGGTEDTINKFFKLGKTKLILV